MTARRSGHARLLSEPNEAPLCGARDGPWGVRTFDFQRSDVPESAKPSCSIAKVRIATAYIYRSWS
jgi:hypothetical protein